MPMPHEHDAHFCQQRGRNSVFGPHSCFNGPEEVLVQRRSSRAKKQAKPRYRVIRSHQRNVERLLDTATNERFGKHPLNADPSNCAHQSKQL